MKRAAALELGWWRDGTTTITRAGKVFKPCPDCGHDAEHDQGMCLFCHPPARPYSGADRSFLNPFVGNSCLRCDEPLSGLQERYCSDKCRKRANDGKPRPNPQVRYTKKVSTQVNRRPRRASPGRFALARRGKEVLADE